MTRTCWPRGKHGHASANVNMRSMFHAVGLRQTCQRTCAIRSAYVNLLDFCFTPCSWICGNVPANVSIRGCILFLHVATCTYFSDHQRKRKHNSAASGTFSTHACLFIINLEHKQSTAARFLNKKQLNDSKKAAGFVTCRDLTLNIVVMSVTGLKAPVTQTCHTQELDASGLR